MRIFGRLLQKLDDNLTTVLDRHLETAIPTQRPGSPEPVRHLKPLGQQFQVLDYFSHCACCLKYTPQPCPVIHRTPCDRSECGELDDAS